MDDPDRLIEVAVDHREAGMPGLVRLTDEVERGIRGLQGVHGGPWCHEVLRAGVTELEGAVEDAHLGLVESLGTGGVADQGGEFLR